MIRTVDKDPWGKPYKIVMKRLRGTPPIKRMEPELLEEVVTTLFPERRRTPDEENATVDGEDHGLPAGAEFLRAEVDIAVERFKR